MSPADLGQSDNDFIEVPLLTNEEVKVSAKPDKSMISDELDQLLRRNIQEFENNFNKKNNQSVQESPPKTQHNYAESQPHAIKYIDDFDSDDDQDISEQNYEIIDDP